MSWIEKLIKNDHKEPLFVFFKFVSCGIVIFLPFFLVFKSFHILNYKHAIPMMILVGVAYLLTMLVVGKLSLYPRVSSFGLCFSILLFSYMAIILVISAVRVYYSRSYLLISFLLSLLSLLTLKYLEHKHKRLRFVLLSDLGGNEAEDLARLNIELLHAGNFGRPNDMETIIEASKMLKEYDDIVFLFAGDGAKKRWVEEQQKKWKLRNLILLGSYSRKDQQQILNASDISLISLIDGMGGISMPSRFYNILASGRPVIAIVDGDTEVASLIKKEGIGWIVSPGDYNSLVKAILEARADHFLLKKGQKARSLAEKNYSFDRIISLYRRALNDIDA